MSNLIMNTSLNKIPTLGESRYQKLPTEHFLKWQLIAYGEGYCVIRQGCTYPKLITLNSWNNDYVSPL